ncbi:MAG: hypothetical protein IMW97_04755 [Firmicutes bacterium]|nr:hypothetical protein [Candidatus Fermentithermobacillaceae bacterium]
MISRQFLLYVVPRPDGSYGVELRQRLNGASQDDAQPLVRVWDAPLQASLPQVLEALRQSGYRPSDLTRGRREPFELRENQGVRLALTLLALKPLRKTSRMERIAEGIRSMPDEEAYYWFSKATSAGSARRALRVLLGGE